MGEAGSLSKKVLLIGLVIGLVIGLGMGYAFTPEADSTELERQISDLKGQVSSLQGQVDKKDSQIRTLQSQISDLTKQVEELQTLLGPIERGSWDLIETFSGKSGVTTDYFYVAGTELRINWTWSSSAEEHAGFNICLYREGQTTWTSFLFDLQKEGTNYVHNIKSARYYLEIFEANLDQWTVTIEVWIPE